MSRTPRQFQIGDSPVYHVVNRGILKQTIFHDVDDWQTFLRILKRYKERAKFQLFHWCLMGNHYHLILELEDPRRISSVIGGIQQVYAGYYHGRYGTAGRLFGSRFKSQVIEKDAYQAVCGRYVERNPVRAGLVAEAWEWGHSSARFYAMGLEDGLTDHDPLVPVGGHAKYAKWLAEETEEETKLFRSTETVIGRVRQVASKLVHSGRVLGPRRGGDQFSLT